VFFFTNRERRIRVKWKCGACCAAKEKTVELPMQQPQQMTTKHVVSQDMVPTFIVPLKPETRVPEKSITR